MSVARDMPLDSFLGNTSSRRSASATSVRLMASLQGDEADDDDVEERDGSEELLSGPCTSGGGRGLRRETRGLQGTSTTSPFMT